MPPVLTFPRRRFCEVIYGSKPCDHSGFSDLLGFSLFARRRGRAWPQTPGRTGGSANEDRIDVFDEMLSVVIAVLGVVLNDPGVGGVDRDPGSKNIGVLKIPDVA